MKVVFKTPRFKGTKSEFITNEVEFSAERINVLLGENGAGKTTVFNSILGLTKGTEFAFQGFKIDDVFMFSQTIKFPPDLRTKEILDILIHCDKRQTLKFFKTYIQYVEKNKLENASINAILERVWDRKYSELSQGEQKILFCHIMLYVQRKFFIIDEITSGIDPKHRMIIMDELHKLSKKSFVLISTHILDDIQNYKTMISYVEDQRILFTKLSEDIDLQQLYSQQTDINFSKTKEVEQM